MKYKIGQWVTCEDDCGQEYCGKIIKIDTSGSAALCHIDLGPTKNGNHWIPFLNQTYGYGIRELFSNKQRKKVIENYKKQIISLNKRIKWLSIK